MIEPKSPVQIQMLLVCYKTICLENYTIVLRSNHSEEFKIKVYDEWNFHLTFIGLDKACV